MCAVYAGDIVNKAAMGSAPSFSFRIVFLRLHYED